MKIEIGIYKKDQGPFCSFDGDRHGRFIFDVSGFEYAQAIKLNLLLPKKRYIMSIEAPEINLENSEEKEEEKDNAENDN